MRRFARDLLCTIGSGGTTMRACAPRHARRGDVPQSAGTSHRRARTPLSLVVCLVAVAVGVAVVPSAAVAAPRAAGRRAIARSVVPLPPRPSSTSSRAGTTTTLTYRARLARAGRLTAVTMTVPPGSGGRVTTASGTLRTVRGRLVWTPRRPVPVRAGAVLVLPVRGLRLPSRPGTDNVAVTAVDRRVVLGSNSSPLQVVSAPPAAPTRTTPPASLPPTTPLPVVPLPVIPDGCPTTYPSVATENAQPGSGDWTITHTSPDLQMYATAVSAACGDTVGLRITSVRPVTLTAYRMGYYGGLGARRVWTSPAPVPATSQPAATVDPRTRMVSAASWTTSATLTITGDFVPGVYLVKADDGQDATYAPLTVRDDTAVRHAYLLQQASTTWEAYNDWGGYSFYSGPDDLGGSGSLTHDRPYAGDEGAGQFLSLEQGLVFWAESQGLDVTYWTDQDLHTYGQQLAARTRTLVLPAHDEYYSPEMRHALTEAIGRGVNVVSLGANAVYRKIDFAPGLREFSLDRSAFPVSTTWRSQGPPWDEQTIFGAQYQCAPHGDLTANGSWLFTGVAAGTTIPGFVNGENDRVDPGAPSPSGVSVLATGSGACRTGPWARMDVTAYTAPGGARVVDGSTFAYGCFLVQRCPSNWHEADGTSPLVVSAAEAGVVGRMVTNILSWAATGSVNPPPSRLRTTAAVRVPTLLARVPALPLASAPGQP